MSGSRTCSRLNSSGNVHSSSNRSNGNSRDSDSAALRQMLLDMTRQKKGFDELMPLRHKLKNTDHRRWASAFPHEIALH